MAQQAISNRYSGRYEVLYISCPACGDGKASKWYHGASGCYKHLEINEYGYVRCQNLHGSPFIHWRWDCGKHNGIFQKANEEYLASAFMHLLDEMTTKDFAWYSKLVMNVSEQFKSRDALSVSGTMFFPNESIPITYNLSGKSFTSGSCWIGLIPSHINSDSEYINDSHDVCYFHVSNTKGTRYLSTPLVGSYNVKCFANDNGGKLIGQYVSTIYVSYIKVQNQQTIFKESSSIDIAYNFSTFNNRPEPIVYGSSCWCGIIPAKIQSREESVNDSYDTNYFRMSSKIGSSKLSARCSGYDNKYELRVFPKDNGGQQIGVGIPIVIKRN